MATMVQVAVRMPREEHDRILEAAKKQGIGFAEYIRRCVAKSNCGKKGKVSA